MIIDFTCTACRRPELLERTLLSFRKNLMGVDFDNCTMHINVDPVPDGRHVADVNDIAMQFVGDVHLNDPQSPSFPPAVKWCFTQPDASWCFHLEDDWLLLEPVHIDDLLAVPARVINLRAHNFKEGITRCFLSPGLWDTALMHHVGERLNDWENPECQLWRLTDGLRCGHYYGNKPLVRDIGREWLETSGYTKDTPKPERGVHHWTHWKAR